jgi:hypothetical protein
MWLLSWDKGRDSAVGVATCYGLDGRGIESRWGWDFFAAVQTSLLHNGYRVSFPGVKGRGRRASHPIPSSCRGSRAGRSVPLLPILDPQGRL